MSATASALRGVAALGMMALLAAGIFILGRLSSDDRTAMLLTVVWFALVLIAGLIVARRRPDLRAALATGYLVVAVAAAVVLGLPMLGDSEVNEQVVTADAAGGQGAGNVALASGSFVALAHSGTGTATVVELPNGDRKLTITDFETDNGPDLRVYLSTGDPAAGGELGDFEDLGALKGNVGDQQYDIPGGVDLDAFSSVVVWCRAFSVGFTSASLEST